MVIEPAKFDLVKEISKFVYIHLPKFPITDEKGVQNLKTCIVFTGLST